MSYAPASVSDSRAERLPDSPASRAQGNQSKTAAAKAYLGERVQALRDKLESRANAGQAEQLRSGVREARNLVRGQGEVSQDTADRYVKTVESMRSAGKTPADANCKSTFEFQRAALVHVTRNELRLSVRDLDRARKSGDLQSAAKAYARVQNGLQTLREYPPSTGNREQDLQRKSAYTGAQYAQLSNSKRSSAADLPQDWRDRVQNELARGDKAAGAVMSLTGCRPAEARGIKVTQNDEGDVTLAIKGAKFNEFRGVESREITISRADLEKTQAGRDLSEWLSNCEQRTTSYTGDLSAFRARVNLAFDRAELTGASAYTFRHAQAAELREAGASLSEIAERLGHRSLNSQSKYG
jgi:integrase